MKKLLEIFLIAASCIATYGLLKLRPSFLSNKKADALFNKDNDRRPTHIVCGIPAPDGMLYCRLEIGHGGWHSHHGPVSWYMGNWAEDDYQYSPYGNIPW